ncbi:MAG: ATP-dependent RecD-like DNA helicase [Ruminococcaceae bacterium]|nr:ATP-dependent RecD-like DNA helicase [Oscillospiraceae bacterium]
MNELIKILGEVVNIIYKNEDNGYTVCEIETKDEVVVATGYLVGINEGDIINASGTWTKHNVYGEQFKIEIFEKEIPQSEDAIQKYLSSGIIKGIREKTAKRIVETFGKDSLKIIETSPMELRIIRGISAKKAVEIQQSYIEQMGATTLIMFLQKYNISVNMAAKIYKRFGPMSQDIIKKNPYVLVEEIEGIGFKTADDAAIKMGIEKDNKYRIKSGTLYTLKYNTQFGHTFLPYETLVDMSSKLLNVDLDKVKDAIELLLDDAVIVDEVVDGQKRIYHYRHYFAEQYVAKRLVEFAHLRFDEDDERILKDIERFEKLQKINLATLQKEAVINAVKNGALVITGGPGTGKTTIINTIISIMEEKGLKVALTAPTGRAAKRMSQVCQSEAKTIHRLLGVDYTDNDEVTFCSDESNPLGYDIIIVDEMSMVDITLMQGLLKAINHGARLIMVGDTNQLPSVGPGNVLDDIIQSGIIKVIRLTEIFRQAEKSMIVVNAHKINKGEMPVSNGENTDFFFASIENAQRGADYILSLCLEKLPQKYDIKASDIQVLSPYKKGIAGINNLNNLMQEKINPPQRGKAEKEYSDIVFREGDKVMQIKNNYDIEWQNIYTGEEGSGVFNGDVGYIGSINLLLKTIDVIYDDKKVSYDFKELDQIELAYAITVHKSQGSEFDCVIIPVYDGPYMLINRNLFYTAVTRAKNLVVLVGSERIIKKMIENDKQLTRYSGLKEKLFVIGR